LNLATAQDIVSQALRFAGEVTDPLPAVTASEYRPKALEYVNRLYLACVAGGNEFDVEMAEPFPWAISQTPGILNLRPGIDVIASLAQGALNGTLSTAPVDQYGNQVSIQGSFIQFENYSDMYIVTSHIAGQTAFTVDASYLNPTQTNSNASVYFLNYTIGPNILRLTTSMRLYQIQDRQSNGEIIGSDLSAMRREFPISYLQTRYPDRFCITGQDTLGNFNIQINTNPLDYARVEYDWVPVPTLLTDDANNQPLVPLQHRMALAYGAASLILQDKNDTRSDKYYKLTQDALSSMVKAAFKQRVDTNRERGRLTPRQDLQNNRRSVPWFWGWW
jgi:hypothetical protein